MSRLCDEALQVRWDARCIDDSKHACRGVTASAVPYQDRRVTPLSRGKDGTRQALTSPCDRHELVKERGIGLVPCPPPRRDRYHGALQCAQVSDAGIHLSYRWPNWVSINGLLCCCRLSIYMSAKSDISGKLHKPCNVQLAAAGAASGC